MFTFKDCISAVPVFRFVYDNMQFSSPLGRNELMLTAFVSDAKQLETSFNDIEKVWTWQKNNVNHSNTIKQLLSSIQDIFNTLFRLKNSDALDDIELFEIKKNALIMQEISQILTETSFPLFNLFDVKKVIEILDPEKSSLPHFYIYSSYSKELASLRNKSKTATSQEESEDLAWQISKLENKIRQHLVTKIAPFALHLEQNLKTMAQLDLWFAKVTLALEWNCCKPVVSNEKTSYAGLFHPVVLHRLEKENTKFQPIDIELKQEPCLITGANMTGKSVFLRAIAFSQWLFQFGFYVPAQKATIIPVDTIHFVSGDSDTENTGLSSFVKEIFHVHQILQEAKSGKTMLVLVDEFARTTNPKEGVALVMAFLEIMRQHNAISLVTTHYSNVEGNFRRLRVKGIQWAQLEHIKTNPQEMNKFIDYQLEDFNEKTAPEEAVKIAEILAIDDAFISLVKRYL